MRHGSKQLQKNDRESLSKEGGQPNHQWKVQHDSTSTVVVVRLYLKNNFMQILANEGRNSEHGHGCYYWRYQSYRALWFLVITQKYLLFTFKRLRALNDSADFFVVLFIPYEAHDLLNEISGL